MVKTCANPVCDAPFHYWRGGRLFRCDVRTPDRIRQLKSARSSVFFWLCENCCSTMTLRFDQHTGLEVVPLNRTAGDAFITSARDVQELRA